MVKWRKVLISMVFCVGLLLVCASQADAGINSYWQVDEYIDDSALFPGATDVWFGVTNRHLSESLAGFAVTINPEHVNDIFDRGAATDWMAETVYKDWWDQDYWSWMTTSSDSNLKHSAQWFFGGTWEELFGDDDTDVAMMFWAKQNETPPNDIPAGETWKDDGGDPAYPLFYYTFGDEVNEPFSTAVIRMESGLTASGGVDIPHSFPADGPAIPEPATLTLMGLGIIGAALRRRRK